MRLLKVYGFPTDVLQPWERLPLSPHGVFFQKLKLWPGSQVLLKVLDKGIFYKTCVFALYL